MSTYAEYRLWAGIARDRHGEWRIGGGEWPAFLTEVEESGREGVERDRLRFVEIFMHGEPCGIGVIMHEFSWTTAIEKENEFDPLASDRARDILERVRRVFAAEHVLAVAKLYHHIDLGG